MEWFRKRIPMVQTLSSSRALSRRTPSFKMREAIQIRREIAMANPMFGRYCGAVLTILFSLVLFAPAPANAQQPASNLKNLQSSLKPGDTVRVREADGNNAKGKVISVTDSVLKVSINGVSREFREPQIREIKLKYSDPIGNGVIWGVII